MTAPKDDNQWSERCPRYVRCSVNCCPLDPRNPRRPSLPGDPEGTCRAHLRDRLILVAEALGAGVEIPGGGLRLDEVGRPADVLLAYLAPRSFLAPRSSASSAFRAKPDGSLIPASHRWTVATAHPSSTASPCCVNPSRSRSCLMSMSPLYPVAPVKSIATCEDCIITHVYPPPGGTRFEAHLEGHLDAPWGHFSWKQGKTGVPGTGKKDIAKSPECP